MSLEQDNKEVKEESIENTEKPAIDVEALVARVEQLEQSKSRILEESKQYKDKYRNLRDNVEKEQAAKLEEGENWKELLDMEKNRTHALNEDLTKHKKITLKKELHFQVAKHATDAFDIDDVIKSLPKDLISIDEESLSIKGVQEAVGMIKEQKPYLFQRDTKHGMTNARPNGQPPKEKSLEDKINENPSAALESILGEYLK